MSGKLVLLNKKWMGIRSRNYACKRQLGGFLFINSWKEQEWRSPMLRLDIWLTLLNQSISSGPPYEEDWLLIVWSAIWGCNFHKFGFVMVVVHFLNRSDLVAIEFFDPQSELIFQFTLKVSLHGFYNPDLLLITLTIHHHRLKSALIPYFNNWASQNCLQRL
jgi:hypothetical protein